ncbi:MAG: septum site-determining protein MinC [Anaerolineae bacterium]|nr:septum site-determining protein MinC [Anaerolineae bacterium]
MVQIKGIREGLLVSIGEGEWFSALTELYQEIDRQSDFLQGAKVILDVEDHSINAASLGKLRDVLSDKGVTLWAVLSNSSITEQNAQTLGLATRIHEAEKDKKGKASELELEDEDGLLIRRTIRSGHSIEFAGHVTIIGDVNPGAEVIAGGDIVVWGRLGGMAHAGAEGDESAVVCALDLSPTQLRIAGQIAIAPKRQGKPQPEMAFIRDSGVVAEVWKKAGK